LEIESRKDDCNEPTPSRHVLEMILYCCTITQMYLRADFRDPQMICELNTK